MLRWGLASLALLAAHTASAQDVTWTGAGADDNWFNAANWDSGVPGAASDVKIVGGSPTNLNGNALVNSLTLATGEVLNIQANLNLDFTGTAATTLSSAGTINQANNTDFQFWGPVFNSGLIAVNNAGSLTDIQIEGSVSLSGGGTISLGGSTGNSRILDETGPADGVLNNIDNTIQGTGSIGGNRTQVLNSGLIDANQAGRALALDPINAGSEFNNTGTLRASNEGILRLEGTGGGRFFNTGGLIEAQDGSTVQLTGIATVVGGTLQSIGTGQVVVGPTDDAVLENVTFAGQLNVQTNTDLELRGSIDNSGIITVSNAGNLTDLQIEGNVTLSGGGTIVLGGTTDNSRILDEVGTADGILTNLDNTIQGRGNIGGGRTQIVNAGLIIANDSMGVLTLDPINAGDQFTNTGTLRAASGGTLSLTGAAGGAFLNSGGLIEAQDGSTVRLTNIATVVGGTLQSTGTGQIVVGPTDNAVLENVTFAGQLNVQTNTDLELRGSIDNSGIITVSNAGNLTDLQIEGNVTLSGGGTIVLGGTTDNSRILDETGTADGILTNLDNTIQGRGNIGGGRTQIVNSGLIIANNAMGVLTIDPINAGDQFTNTGTLRATSGGTLSLTGSLGGSFLNAGGVIEAQDGSTVRLTNNAAVVGGTLQSFGTGQVVVGPTDNAVLENVTFAGQLNVQTNTDLELRGSIDNSGIITVSNAGNLTDLQIEGDVTLTGGGSIVLGGTTGNSRILDETASATGVLTNVDNIISGVGTIGGNRMGLINQGTISANVAGRTLVIDPITATASTPWVNDGTLQAIGGAELRVTETLHNFGIATGDMGSQIETTGHFVNYGTVQGGASISSSGDFQNHGLLSPGESAGTLQIAALDAILHEDSEILIEIAGNSASEFDVIDFTLTRSQFAGKLFLGGDLMIDLDGYTPTSTDFFDVITATSGGGMLSPLDGFFANVTDGGILPTLGNEGFFTVSSVALTNGDVAIRLSNFTANVPEPNALIILAVGLVILAGLNRRRLRLTA